MSTKAPPAESVSLESEAYAADALYYGFQALNTQASPMLEAAEWTWVQTPGVVCTMRPTRWELTKRWIVELIRPAKKRERQRQEQKGIDLLKRRIEAWEANEHQG